MRGIIVPSKWVASDAMNLDILSASGKSRDQVSLSHFRNARALGRNSSVPALHIRAKCLLMFSLGSLLQSVDHIKVGEQAAIAIDVGFCVGSH